MSRSLRTTSQISIRHRTSARAPNSPTCSIRSIACRAFPNRVGDGADAGRGQAGPRRSFDGGAKAASFRARWRRRATPTILAVNGRGWFQIAGTERRTLYTRAGSFNTNADGQLVTADGYQRRSRDHHSAGNGRGHRQQIGPGVCQAGQGGRRRARSASSTLPTLPMRRASIRWEAISTRRQSRPAFRLSGPGDPGYGKIHQHYLESFERRSRQGNYRADLGPALL